MFMVKVNKMGHWLDLVLDLGHVHTTPLLYKNGEKNLRFCESVHTDPHKNATKT